MWVLCNHVRYDFIKLLISCSSYLCNVPKYLRNQRINTITSSIPLSYCNKSNTLIHFSLNYNHSLTLYGYAYGDRHKLAVQLFLCFLSNNSNDVDSGSINSPVQCCFNSRSSVFDWYCPSLAQTSTNVSFCTSWNSCDITCCKNR